ncbi:MAG TPA: hypothetical protein VM939_05935, partial [Gemmatimonadaceae bacterium]|nr:hypothetical protein [Gemmatimonadaceae bacterium]
MSDQSGRSVGVSGVVTRSQEATFLTGRAAQYLANGPADVVDLIGHICNLPRAPRIVAEHMAEAMFAGRPEFSRDSTGKWGLTAAHVTSASLSIQTSNAAPAYAPYTPVLPSAIAGSDLIVPVGVRARLKRPRRTTPELPPEPIAGTSFVVVDVETTGGAHFRGDRITEFAAVVV